MTETHLHPEVLTVWDDVQAHAQEWRDLFSRGAKRRPFQSFAWIDIWWRIFGAANPSLSPHIVFFRDASSQLVGISPLMFRRAEDGLQIEYLTAPFADYLDSLYLPGFAYSVFTSLEAHLFQQGLQKHLLLEEISSDTEVASLFSQGHARPSKWLWRPAGWCTSINLNTENPRQQEFIRHEYLRKYRRLARRGNLQVVHHTDQAAMLAHLTPLVDMHERQWRGRANVIASFDEPGMLDFYVAMCNYGDGRDPGLKPVLSELRWGNSPVAYYFGFVAQRKYLGYRTTFEVEIARESPGHVLLTLLCEDLRRRGFVAFDLMRGDHDYKNLYGNYRVPQGCLELVT